MYCQHGTLTNTKGDSLIGYFVECVTAAGVVQTIYSDANSTAIAVVSGVANRALVDSRGNYSYYVSDGEYLEKYYNALGIFQFTSSPYSMIGLDGVAIAAANGHLFSAMPAQSVSANVTNIRTTGYTTVGIGAADYVYDAAVDAAYVIANPLTSFRTINGRGFRLSTEQAIKPQMLGAIGDGTITDDTAAINAMLRYARTASVTRQVTIDFSQGEFLISGPLYFVFPFTDGDQPIVKIIGGGRFRTAPLASWAGGIPDYCIEVAGPRQVWLGRMEINYNGAADYAQAYVDRPLKGGFRFRCVSYSSFCDIYVDSVRRDAVLMDSGTQSGGTTAFTVDGVSFPNASNIGARLGHIYTRYSGSCQMSAAGYGLNYVPSARVQGGVTNGESYNGLEAFGAGFGGYGGSIYQRDKYTISSTANLAIYDKIKSRLEIGPAIFGTIAADNGTRTFTWTAGDPTTYLQVGDTLPGFTSGPNAGITYKITGFSGGSNRVITVDVAPTTVAASASAIYTMYGEWVWQFVSQIVDATNFLAFPCAPTRTNSSIYVVHGAVLKCRGSDGAAVQVKSVGGLVVAQGIDNQTLYGPVIENFLADYADIGVGDVPQGNSIGLAVMSGHMEASGAPYLIAGAMTGAALNTQAVFNLDLIERVAPRSAANQQYCDPYPLGRVQLMLNGQVYQSNQGTSNEGQSYATYGISNEPDRREIALSVDTVSMTLGFSRKTAALFPHYNWAKMSWGGLSGATPTGSLTVTLDSALINQGWLFVGDASGSTFTIPAPGCRIDLDFEFIVTGQKVRVTRSQSSPTIKAQAANAYTFVLDDRFNYLRHTNAGATTVTVPTNASVPFPIGTRLPNIQAGAGTVTIAPAGGVTINTFGADLILQGQWSEFDLVKVAADTWDFQQIGPGVAGPHFPLPLATGLFATNTVSGALPLTLISAADRIDATLVIPARDFSVTAISAEVTGAVAASNLKIAVYDYDTLARLAVSADISTAATGIKAWTSNFTFRKGKRYLVAVHSSAAITLRTTSLNAALALDYDTATTGPFTVIRQAVAYAGGMPNPLAGTKTSNITPPLFIFTAA